MEFLNFNQLEKATNISRNELFRLGTAMLFVVAIMIFANYRVGSGHGDVMLVVAAMIGGYMAINIGANDVANNVGPAVGSKALTMTGAILIAAIFEAGGALIAGGDVVSTIKKGIIDPALITDVNTFIWVMTAALLAAALWLNIATFVGAPVSTTHSIVGGVLGAGIAAGGWQIANWDKMGAIASSWIISPVMGGVIAAGFLYLIKRSIIYQADKIGAAKRMVPILIAIMGWAFSSYLLLKGLKKLYKLDMTSALALGFVAAVLIYLLVRPLIMRSAKKLSNDRDSINMLFTIPLIFGAALLSFAHGANDVANAVGPLAAINDAILHGGVVKKAGIPLWVMMVGAFGIALGLMLYGPKLIRTVGSEITELDKMRAFCVALAAAITVIIATQFGLPVSSTHIAVGGVFGVGFLREFLEANYARMLDEIKEHHEDDKDPTAIDAFLEKFEQVSVAEKGIMLQELKQRRQKLGLYKKERKSLRRVYRQDLVKRSMLLKIAAAWVITVPLSGLLSAIFYFTLRGMLLN
ncbi:MAG: inorganic phosphate transporter [Hyphomicrobiales bacterium]|nr:MAG: inorganic phosphate transporter [Hyphomicrobiales bacterium]